MKGTWRLTEGIRRGTFGVVLASGLLGASSLLAQEEDPCAAVAELEAPLAAAQPAPPKILEEVQKLHPVCQLTAEAQGILARAAWANGDPRLAAEGMLAIGRLQLPGSTGAVDAVVSGLEGVAATRLEVARAKRGAGDLPGAAILGLEAIALDPDRLSRTDEFLDWLLGWVESNEAAWGVTDATEGFRRAESAYLVGNLERAGDLFKAARAKGLDGGRRLKVERYLELIETERRRAEAEREESEEADRAYDEAREKREKAEEMERKRQEVAERTKEELEAKFRDERRRVEIEGEISKIEARLAELAGVGSYEAIQTLDGKIVLLPTDYSKIWNEERQLKARRRELDMERANLR